MKTFSEKYLYCILPSGNVEEFGCLDGELVKREVAAQYCGFKRRIIGGGGRIYRVPKTDLHKLPKDGDSPYLGNDESGHSMYEMPDVQKYRRKINATRWKKITLFTLIGEAK
jgi:hypothetical protein